MGECTGRGLIVGMVFSKVCDLGRLVVGTLVLSLARVLAYQMAVTWRSEGWRENRVRAAAASYFSVPNPAGTSPPTTTVFLSSGRYLGRQCLTSLL